MLCIVSWNTLNGMVQFGMVIIIIFDSLLCYKLKNAVNNS